MTPLTEDCARARALLPGYHDAELLESERARVDAHLARCPGCRQSLEQLRGALRALRSSLSAEDLVRLRADLPPERPEAIDARPLARLAIVLGVLLVGALGLAVAQAARGPAPGPVALRPSAPAVVMVAPRAIPLPAVGGSIGLEEDPELLALLEAPPPPLVIAPPPEPEPAPEPIALPEPEPEPVAAAPEPAKQDPGPAPPPAARAITPPIRLPDEARALLTRLQVSDGLGYRGVILFFLRDPDGRDRLTRATPGLLVVREASPSDPASVQVAPPRGEGASWLLAGELLDAPLGLRIALRDREIDGRRGLECGPVAYDPQRGRDVPPLLRGPVVLPGRARAALFREGTGGAVRELLAALRDPSLLELRRLRDELQRVESEARELDRRLRSLLRDERGLRGVALTVNGQPRSLDLFADGAELSEALPKLLRSALLEAALEREERTQEDILGDPRPTTIERGLRVGQERWRPLLDALAEATEEEGSTFEGVTRFRAAQGYLELRKASILHAYGAP